MPELRQIFLPTIRDDYRLVENYRSEPSPQLSCPIHTMYGESDPEVTESHAAAWAAYTRDDWHGRPFPGDHFYLAAHTAQVVAYLSEILNRPHFPVRLTPTGRPLSSQGTFSHDPRQIDAVNPSHNGYLG